VSSPVLALQRKWNSVRRVPAQRGHLGQIGAPAARVVGEDHSIGCASVQSGEATTTARATPGRSAPAIQISAPHGPPGPHGVNVQFHVVGVDGERCVSVSCPWSGEGLMAVWAMLRQKRIATARNVLNGTLGQSGPSAARHAVVERGPEAETVCCRLTREAATISDVWARLMRERPVLKIPAPSGRSGVSGPSARSLVEAEFRCELANVLSQLSE